MGHGPPPGLFEDGSQGLIPDQPAQQAVLLPQSPLFTHMRRMQLHSLVQNETSELPGSMKLLSCLAACASG